MPPSPTSHILMESSLGRLNRVTCISSIRIPNVNFVSFAVPRLNVQSVRLCSYSCWPSKFGHSLPLSRKSGFCPEFGQTAKTARFLSRKIGNLQYPLNSRKIKGVWGNIEENEAVFRPIFPIFIPNFGLWWKNRDKSQKIGLKNFFVAFGRTDYSVESCIFSRFLSRFRD